MYKKCEIYVFKMKGATQRVMTNVHSVCVQSKLR